MRRGRPSGLRAAPSFWDRADDSAGESAPALPDFELYDLWNDPFSLAGVREQYPGLAEKYRELLKREWQDHLRLAERFKRTPATPANSQQPQTPRSIGYLR